jgi:hypothetical protein
MNVVDTTDFDHHEDVHFVCDPPSGLRASIDLDLQTLARTVILRI